MQQQNLFAGWKGLGNGDRSAQGGNARPMTAPDHFAAPFDMHPSALHHPSHAGITSGGHDPVLFAPVPHRGRNFSLPGNELLSLPDEPSPQHAVRPSTSGGMPSSSTAHMNLPPTLAAMPGYAYGAAMLAESNARKAQEQQFQTNGQGPAAVMGGQHDPSNYPFAYNAVPPGSADGETSSSRPSTANRPDTGQSYTSTSTVGGPEAQIGTTTIGADGRVYQFIGVTTQHKKRARRKFDEIERMYACNFPGCTKSYGCLNHLNAHVMTQKHGPKRLPAEFKEMRKEWRMKKKQEEAAKKAEEEERKKQGIQSPEPEPGPVIPPTAATVLTSAPQAGQMLARPLTGPGQVPRPGLMQGFPASASAVQDPGSLFAFQPPPLAAHPPAQHPISGQGSAQYMQPYGSGMYNGHTVPAAMRPSTAPSQFAFNPPMHHQDPAAAFAAASGAASANALNASRPSSSSIFSFQPPDASEAVQSFGSISGHPPVSPTGSIHHGHSVSPVSGTPPTSMSDHGRRFSLPMGGLGGIPEDSAPTFSPVSQEGDHTSATTPFWMDAPGNGSGASSGWKEPGGTSQTIGTESGNAPTPNSAWLDSVTRQHSASPHGHSPVVPGVF